MVELDICACIGLCMHEVRIGCLGPALSLATPFLWDGISRWAKASLVASKLQGTLGRHLPQHWSCRMSGYTTSAGDLNSGLHACTTTPSSQPRHWEGHYAPTTFWRASSQTGFTGKPVALPGVSTLWEGLVIYQPFSLCPQTPLAFRSKICLPRSSLVLSPTTKIQTISSALEGVVYTAWVWGPQGPLS